MIGLGSELLIKTGLIMKKRVMKKNMFGRKANGVQKVMKKSAMAKEQRTGTGSSIW